MSKLKVNNIEALSDPDIKLYSNIDFQNSKNIINVSGVTAQNVTVLGTLTSAGFAPSGDLTSNGNFQVGSTSVFNINSSNGNTGVSGTLGVVGAVSFGNNLDVSGNTNVSGTLVSLGDFEVGSGKLQVDATTGDTTVGGLLHVSSIDNLTPGDPVTIADPLTVTGITKINDSSDSTSVLTGALQVSGGIGVAKKVNIGDAENSTSISTGSLRTLGGVGIAKNVHIGESLVVSGTTDSTSKDTGSFVLDGGAGIEKNLHVGGNEFVSGTLQVGGGINFLSSTDSSSTSTGALQVSGGVGVAKNLHVGEILNTKSLSSINEYITAEASATINTGRLVSISGNGTNSVTVKQLSGIDTPIAFHAGSSNINSGTTATFIKRGVIDTTLAVTAVGDPIYSDSSGALSTTSSSFLVGFALTTGANAKVYLNIGGSGGGGSATTITTSSQYKVFTDGASVGVPKALTFTPLSNSSIVFVGGVIQEPSKYTISGSNITFNDAIPTGISIVIYGITSNVSAPTPIDNYVSATTLSISNNASSLLGETESCSYRFFVQDDPRICGDINLIHNGASTDPDVRVDTNSAKVSITSGTSNSLNIYIASNKINIENKLGTNKVLMLYKFKMV